MGVRKTTPFGFKSEEPNSRNSLQESEDEY